MNKNDILNEAIGQLTQHTGITADWKVLEGTHPDKGENMAMTLNINGKLIVVMVQVKRTVQPYQLDGLAHMKKEHPLVIVTEQIYPGMKELLRKNGIGYLDGAGNIYLQTDDQLIWLEGQKTIKQKEPIVNRAFTRAGLQTVFYLLQHPDAINDPYRLLAERTGTALGNIGFVIDGLKAAGFILPFDKKQLQLIKRDALIERWIEGYRETLKPTLYQGNFRFKNPDFFYDRDDLIAKVEGSVWGGEPAAEILTHHLQPGLLTVYTPTDIATLMRNWILIPDPNGNVQVYRKFWKDPIWDERHVAPALLIYADLVLTGDPRNLETANLIYYQHLQNVFE